MKYPITFAYLAFAITFTSGQSLHVSAGRLIRIENFHSRFIPSRNIDIWLPNDYTFTKKYSVLYMQDGQMLFNADQNSNHQEWEVDETLDSLISKSAIQDCIVVGIWNNGFNKLSEYYPQKALEYIPSKSRKKFIKEQLGSKPYSDEYLKFIVLELKPYIDKNFSVWTNPENNFIVGSLEGALIALYAVCEYPDVFHSAVCISNYWYQDEHIPYAILKYLKKHTPDPTNHSFYFDYDTSHSLESYNKYQTKINTHFTKKKYTNKNYLSVELNSEIPNEENWSKRFYMSVMFLLGKNIDVR